MKYKLTIEHEDPDTGEFVAPVVIVFNSQYTIDTDLVEWVREEIDPKGEVSAP